MSWQAELDELAQRHALAATMGGAEKIQRHRDNGKLTVRERIDHLVDAGSFVEVGGASGVARYDADGKLLDLTATNQVMGRARIGARDVVIVGDDFTIRGGAADAGILEKFVHPERMANALRLPIVRLVDGTGGGGSVKSLESMGYTYVPMLPGWSDMVANLAAVPVVGLALGSVAGLGAARVAATHYSVMVRDTAQLFAAGPPVVARVGPAVTKEELGGVEIHGGNGMIDDVADSEDDAFERARRFLSYLPQSIHELPARSACDDDAERRDEALLSVVPRNPARVYKIRPVIESLFDGGSFFEIGRGWGKSSITGLARLDGWPVAVIASDPYHYGGAWTARSSEKLVRFVDMAQTFHLPVVHLVDIPGFHIGVDAERAATLRAGARAMCAIQQATVPWCSIILRKAFGVAGAMHRPQDRYTMRAAWPSGEWGSLPIAGGLEAAYKADLDRAPDRAAALAEIELRLRRVTSPFRTAERFGIEDIIDPRDTRRFLTRFAALAAPLRQTGPSSFGLRP